MDAQLQRYLLIAIFGIVAGWLAGIVVGHPRFGLLGSLVAGLLGAVVGSWLFAALGLRFSVGNAIADNLIVASVGAIIVILIARILL
jgi:uncharacterized membrane protein YeaQ/YmgE (transglycosylase-associated protein family)